MGKRRYCSGLFPGVSLSPPSSSSCGKGGGGDVVTRGYMKHSKDLLVRLELQKKLEVHNGCVNTISWNQNGTLILSGSDDHKLVVSDPFSYVTKAVIPTPHNANIFSAKFLPESCDLKVVSCAGDGVIVYTDLDTKQADIVHSNAGPLGTLYDVLTVPGDPHSVLSCGEDGAVRWFDLRVNPNQGGCDSLLIQCSGGVSSMDLHPLLNYQLAVGSSDSCVRLYDRRMLDNKGSGLSGLFSKFCAPGLEGQSHRITSVQFRPDGEEVLASYSSDYLYIFNPKEDATKGRRLKVGRLSRTKKASKTAPKSYRDGLPVKKLRLRGDWSDTGPNSRPETEVGAAEGSADGGGEPDSATSRQAALMQRMTFALSRMLNDPGTRLAMERMNETPQGSRSTSRGGGGGSSGGSSQGRSAARQSAAIEIEVPSEGIQGASAAAAIESSATGNVSTREQTAAAEEAGAAGGGSETRNLASSVAASLTSPRTAAAASAIQDSWRRYRERKLEQRRQTFIEISAEGEPSVAATGVETRHRSTNQETISSQPVNAGDGQNSASNDNPTWNCSDDDTNDNIADEASVLHNNNSTDAQTESQADSLQNDPKDVHNSCHDIGMDVDGHDESTLGCDNDSAVGDGNTTGGGDTATLVDENVVHESIENMAPEHADEASDHGDQYDNMHDLRTSVSTLRESGVEPTVNLRYSSAGTNSSSIQVNPETLPGPSRVVTGPGQVGVDPLTGVRRRRHGVSSVPTSSILPDDRPNAAFSQPNSVDEDSDGIVEYSDDETSDPQDSDITQYSQIIQPPVRLKLQGHRNVRTMMKEASWWGNNFVLSGSDCGHFFAWDARTADIVLIKEADRHVVNCVRPHPTLPLLATSGIDYDVKIWAPTAPESTFSASAAAEVARRNQLMLQETRDTITVPASLMIRMLASLNQLRRGGGGGGAEARARGEDS